MIKTLLKLSLAAAGGASLYAAAAAAPETAGSAAPQALEIRLSAEHLAWRARRPDFLPPMEVTPDQSAHDPRPRPPYPIYQDANEPVIVAGGPWGGHQGKFRIWN